MSSTSQTKMSVIEHIYENQNVLKYLYYTSYNPLSELNVSNPKSLLFENIYPYPFVPGVNDKAKSFINVFMDDLNLNRTNQLFQNGVLCFWVISHLDLWKIDSDLRPDAIMDEIKNDFHMHKINNIGRYEFNKSRIIRLNEKFIGYEITFKNKDLI